MIGQVDESMKLTDQDMTLNSPKSDELQSELNESVIPAIENEILKPMKSRIPPPPEAKMKDLELLTYFDEIEGANSGGSGEEQEEAVKKPKKKKRKKRKKKTQQVDLTADEE